MARPEPAEPVKLFVAVLWADETALDEAKAAMMRHWGPIDFEGRDHPFDRTDYYHDEMGTDLKRRLLAFERLVPPESLRQAKLACNRIEDELRRGEGRRVNLDIGYLDHAKIVLGSVKAAGQKIHLGDGVYADLAGRYRGGRYVPFDWTFPDFEDGRYDRELDGIRSRYLRQRKEGART